ncbi:MAG: HDOD domain-containing protein [Deltaproteobacteria bacterium]|nr:HDOD domain-containing protein [Deltaproteobacteria bacterium]MBW2120467.1 HDOD domain-containing protein [Deltaproteobacteria bacterium]
MVRSERISAEKIGKTIGQDYALSAKVLRLVNSAFYGLGERVSSVTSAVVLLGFNVVQGVVLSASVFELMDRAIVGLWEHSLGTAIASGVLARALYFQEPEEVSVAGLLHDIGKVVVPAKMPETYEEIRRRIEHTTLSIAEVEREVLGFDHSRIGMWLADEWNFPPNLTEPIVYHHTPSLAKEARIQTAIVHLADILIRAKGFGFGGDPWVPEVNREAWNLLGLSVGDLEHLVSRISEEIFNVEGVDWHDNPEASNPARSSQDPI